MEGSIHPEPPGLDALRSGLSKATIEGRTYYVVEGDLLLDDSGLEEYVRRRDAQRLIAKVDPEHGAPRARLVGTVLNGRPVRWKPGVTLTYCVARHTFPDAATYDTVRANMGRATLDWSRTCGVGFEHRAELDGSTEVRPPGVLFTVRFHAQAARLIAAGFYPHDPVNRRHLFVFPLYFNTSYDRVGILRHELGHILGFRHEHIRSGAPPSCPDDEGTWGAWELTAYDPQSVMHYFCEDGVGSHELRITAVDQAGAERVYGAPLHEFELAE